MNFFNNLKERKEKAKKERVENYKKNFNEKWDKILKNGYFKIADIEDLLSCDHCSAESIANNLCKKGLVVLTGNVYFIGFVKQVESEFVWRRDYIASTLL